jgi:histidine triad (HIT) family protein
VADEDTIFGKIIRGEIPCVKVCEDEKTFCFMDIMPASKGHCLVVPKKAAADIFEIEPDELAHVAKTAQTVAKAIDKALRPDGINIIQNSRPASGQTVFHLHMHIVPRWEGDGVKLKFGVNEGDMDEIQAIAEQIRAAL